MKSNLFMRICAVVLAGCIATSLITTVQITKAYATDNTDTTVNNENPSDDQTLTDSEEPESKERSSQPDPLDYDLTCYTPNIDFGAVYTNQIVPSKQFGIVNIGANGFPLTWECIDPTTTFTLGAVSQDLYLDPGETITFSIGSMPTTGFEEGVYKATYIFYSLNDYRRTHSTTVTVTMTVKKNDPYITSVTVSPGTVSVPAGKSYQFDAAVSGGNDYDASVTWSLVGNKSVSTGIDSSGKLVISSDEPAGSFGVIATSRQDKNVFGRAVVTVTKVDHMISVKADPSDGGAVAGGGAVRDGASATVSASPNNNFVFKGWYEGGNLVSNSGQYALSNISTDHNLVAKFERKSCYIRTSVNDTNAGSVTQSASIGYGGKMTITAKANSGYRFVAFAENNQTISTSPSIELNNVTTDRNIVAVFDRDICNVNVSVYPQDTGKYEGAGRYNKGSKVELRATAYDGYEFVGWSINGQIVSKDTKYTIDKINNDVNVVANFNKKNAVTYKMVSGISAAGGAIVPSGEQYVAEGSSVTYNMSPQPGYRIAAVMVDGKNVGAIASYTFNNIRYPHTITVSFEKKPEEKPAANNSGAASKKSAEKQANPPKKIPDYNSNTAANGAIPEQNIVPETPETNSDIDDEDYEDDVITEATDINDGEAEFDAATGSVMARHNLDEGTLRILINDDAVKPMLREAIEDGTLKITVNNSYAPNTQETADAYNNTTQWSLTNFDDVIVNTLSEDEKVAVLTGTPISFNVDIAENSDEVNSRTKELMQSKVGYKPVSYFDFTIMKTSGGTTSVIESTNSDLEVVVPIPEQFRKEGRKFYVIREHNGVVDVLQDIGNDPNTVTFRTDRFSEYAIAYEAVNINRLILRFAIITVIALVLAVVCYVNLIKYRRRAWRMRNNR